MAIIIIFLLFLNSESINILIQIYVVVDSSIIRLACYSILCNSAHVLRSETIECNHLVFSFVTILERERERENIRLFVNDLTICPFRQIATHVFVVPKSHSTSKSHISDSNTLTHNECETYKMNIFTVGCFGHFWCIFLLLLPLELLLYRCSIQSISYVCRFDIYSEEERERERMVWFIGTTFDVIGFRTVSEDAIATHTHKLSADSDKKDLFEKSMSNITAVHTIQSCI